MLSVSQGHVRQVAQSQSVHLALHRALHYQRSAKGCCSRLLLLQWCLHCSSYRRAVVHVVRCRAAWPAAVLPRDNCMLCPWHDGILLQLLGSSVGFRDLGAFFYCAVKPP